MRYQIPRLEDYDRHIGGQAVERILAKAARLNGFHVTHINSTYYGGGVAELLSSLTLLPNRLGIRAGRGTGQPAEADDGKSRAKRWRT